MKSAIYIEDGVTQLVLTPGNDFEHTMLKSFADKPMEAVIRYGQFYDCAGGWTRHGHTQVNEDHRSLIIRINRIKDALPPV